MALAFFASGAAGLVYQVAWQRILALHSGVGAYSVATRPACALMRKKQEDSGDESERAAVRRH